MSLAFWNTARYLPQQPDEFPGYSKILAVGRVLVETRGLDSRASNESHCP